MHLVIISQPWGRAQIHLHMPLVFPHLAFPTFVSFPFLITTSVKTLLVPASPNDSMYMPVLQYIS